MGQGNVGFNINLQFGPEWQTFLQGTQEAHTNFIFDAFDPGLERVANFLNNTMVDLIHFVSGQLRASAKVQKIGPLLYQQSVGQGLRYAVVENRRPGTKPGLGPHMFYEPAIQTTIQRAIPLLVDELTRYIVSHFGGPKI
jgi:hypothetical protein